MAFVIPTAAQARRLVPLSLLAFERLGYPEDATPTPENDPLTPVIASAVAYIEGITCRKPLTALPDDLAPLAQRALLMRIAQEVYSDQPGQAETAADSLIVSFSAGSYSETRRSGHDERRYINGWPALEEILWLLMTDECREDWEDRLAGKFAPAGEVQEIEPSPPGFPL